MPREINPWAMFPRKTSTAYLPEALKQEVTTKANELIETVLKPKYVQPAPDPDCLAVACWYGADVCPGWRG